MHVPVYVGVHAHRYMCAQCPRTKTNDQCFK
uniref:Uncharacterized protein n=1 Tax=Arundo donax TaxID=35708 RepID=A0A0A9AYF3_ARUDO